MSNSYKFVWLSFENTQNNEEEEDDSRVAFGPLWYESGHDNAQEHIGIGESHFRRLQARFSTDCNPANLSAFAKSLFLELLGFWSLHQRQSWSHQNDFGHDDNAPPGQYENGLGKDWDDEDNLDEGENPPDFDFDYVVILMNVMCVVILVTMVVGARNEYQKTKSQICILSISMMMTARLTQPWSYLSATSSTIY